MNPYFRALFRSLILFGLISPSTAIGAAQEAAAIHRQKPEVAQRAPTARELPQCLVKAEAFVLNHVKDGTDATFDVNGPACGREVRAEFIEDLLASGHKVTLSRHGLLLKNALIHGFLDLRSAQVPVEVQFLSCQFDDGADFSSSHFLAPLYLDGSQFTALDADLNFNSMTVDNLLSLKRVEFAGRPEFFHLRIASDLFATENIQFKTKDWKVQFDQSQLGGKFFIQNAAFAGSLSLADVSAKGLTIKNVTVQEELDLRNAHIQTVIDLGLAQPFPRTIELEGLTYGDLSGTDVGKQLLTLFGQAPFSAQSYTQLDDYYRLHGQPEDASQVFFAMHGRERDALKNHFLLLPKYVSSLLLDALVGYGREPQRALYVSICVVLIGWFVFRRRQDVVLQKPEQSSELYNPLWYSLDLLTPFIDLHAANVWMPRPDWRFGRNYARIHRIAGWILVPIGIAAITGLIK